MIGLKCKRCGKKWEYKGIRKYYTSCPECKTSVKIKNYGETIKNDKN